MDQYILTILKKKKLFDGITFFADDPIEALKRMYDTFEAYDGKYDIFLYLYVENGKNEEIARLTTYTKRRKEMKTPKEQVIEYVEKRYQKEKEKWSDGLRNQYLEWEDVRNQLFQEQDSTHLYNRIIELENKLKRLKDKYGINE